jgi:hypothetical protein
VPGTIQLSALFYWQIRALGQAARFPASVKSR